MQALLGNTLTVEAGPVIANPPSTSRVLQWLRNGTAISGANASSYNISALDLGQVVSVSQTETNTQGSYTATSEGVDIETESEFLSAFFANSETGAIYDPSDLTSLYQRRTGFGDVTLGGETVAIMLDKSQMQGKTAAQFIIDQPELLPSGVGDGTSLTGWTITGTGGIMSLTSGRIRIENGANSEGVMRRQFNVQAGKNYLIYINKVTGSDANRGGIRFGDAQSAGTFITGATVLGLNPGNGVYRLIFTATATATINLDIGTNSATLGNFIEFDDLSIKEIPGFHAIAPDDAARPLYGREPVTGARNLLYAQTANPANAAQLTKSGDAASTLSIVSDVAALAAAGLSDRATSGTVFRLNNTAGTTSAFARFNHTLTLGGNTWTLSAFVRGTGTAQIDVNAGTWTGAGSFALTGSYQRRASTGASNTSSNQWRIRAAAGADVYFILAMAEVSAAVTNYQLALSALDVTEAGVATRHFLQTDGVDDRMQVLPVCNLGETWAHVGGWRSDVNDRGAFAASNTFRAALRNLSSRWIWRNSGDTNSNITTGDSSVVAVLTVEQASTSALEARYNGGNSSGPITPYDDTASTQGLELFTSSNSAWINGLSGRFFGGAWINRNLILVERAGLERYFANKTGVSL